MRILDIFLKQHEVYSNEDIMPSEFWEWFDKQNEFAHSSSEKREMLKASLRETLTRIYSQECDKSKSIYVLDDRLIFQPSHIDPSNISIEQQRSFTTMYNYAKEHIHANLIFDFHDFTWSNYFKLLSSVTRVQIIDGIRLWSCIPCRVQSVKIIKSKHMNMTIIHMVIPLLSSKIRKKIEIE